MDPDDIETREFPTSLRGYDREEVDAFLRVVAAEVRRLRGALQQQAAVISAGPGQAPAAPSSDASDAYRQVGDETARILVAAEQAARDIRERGQREVAELLADAREEAADIARAAVVDREKVENDIRQLQEARALLGTEMEDLRRRFEELALRFRQPFEVRRPKPKAPEAKRPAEGPFAPDAPGPAAEPVGPAAKPASEAGFLSSPPEIVPFGDDDAPPAPAPDFVEQEVKPAATPVPAAAQPGDPAFEESVTVITRSAPEPPAEPQPAAAAADRNGGDPNGPPPQPAAPAPEPAGMPDLPPPPTDPEGALTWRAGALGDLPGQAAGRLKRLLQDDQNELLERLRTWRGVGPAATHVPPPDRHSALFKEGLWDLLEPAFRAGRVAGGATDPGDAEPTIGGLVTKQLVTPLRRDLLRLIEPPPGWDTSATAASKRASDVYRVWKGVRTDLLGEGLVYAVFHHGLIDAVRGHVAGTKVWVVSSDERNCPKEVCRSNASSGPLGLDAPFPSGHLIPPAHGGCTCTVLFVRS